MPSGGEGSGSVGVIIGVGIASEGRHVRVRRQQPGGQRPVQWRDAKGVANAGRRTEDGGDSRRGFIREKFPQFARRPACR